MRMIRGICGQSKLMPSIATSVKVGALTDNALVKLRVLCVDEPLGKLQAVDWSDKKQHWTHLSHVPFPKCEGSVDMCIGIGVPGYHDILEQIGIKLDPNLPRAKLTPLGWSCAGPIYPESMAANIVAATIGAIILLLLVGLFRRMA